MNRRSFRIVFNARRGQLVAVAETAASQGKSSGERTSRSVAPSQRERLLAAFKADPGWALTLATLASLWAVQPAALAQIMADTNAPAGQRPTVLTDSTGRPLVNIQTPSAAGVSRNTYSRFDVQSNGIVLNNARGSNPWLATGEARVILNEVNSSNPSYLGGAVTVNGRRADVVIANPSGIQVDGASFVNAGRATLTTGTPVIDGGALAGLAVTHGAVEVTAKGLNAAGASYAEIISRSAVINGKVQGSQAINVTTGAQTIDYASGTLTPLAGTGAAPTLAIDTAVLGGMYAGSITLLSTEAGVGVRNQGTLQANTTSGQLIITADGRLHNTGRMDAALTSVATVTGDIDNSGTLLGRQLLMVGAGRDVNHSGTGMTQASNSPSRVLISAKGNVNLAANARIRSTGSQTTSDGTVNRGQVSISAQGNILLASGSSVAANADVQLRSDGTVIAASATLGSTVAQTSVLARQGIALRGSTVTGNQVHLETGAAFEDTSSSISISGGKVDGVQQTAVIATGDLNISTAAATGVGSSAGHTYLQAARSLTVSAGSVVNSAGHITAQAGQQLALQGASGNTPSAGKTASLTAGGDLRLSGAGVSLQGSQLKAGGDIRLEAHGKNGVSLQALRHLGAPGGGTSHGGVQLSATGDVQVSAYEGATHATALQATGRNIAIVSQGPTRIDAALNVSPTADAHQGSQLTASEDLTVGSVGEGQRVQVQASSLSAGKRLVVFGSEDVELLAATDELVLPGAIGPQYTSVASRLDGASVQVQAGRHVLARGAQFNASGGDISLTALDGTAMLSSLSDPAGRSAAKASGAVAVHGGAGVNIHTVTLDAGTSVALTSANGAIASTASTLRAVDVLSASSKGAQTHASGQYTGGAVSIFNQTGTLTLNDTQLKTNATTGAAAQTVRGQLSVESGGNLSVNAGTRFDAATDLSIVAGVGDITIAKTRPSSSSSAYYNPWEIMPLFSLWQPSLAQDQLKSGRALSIMARNGNLVLDGAMGTNGYGSSQRVALTTNGDLSLAGNNVTLRGSVLRANYGTIKLTATTGDLTVEANKVIHVDKGFANTYWDRAELVSSNGIDARAAGNMALNGVYAHTWGRANFQSGGDLTTSGKVNRWQVDNRPSAGSSYNGWYQDEEWVNYTMITGYQGVNLGALGGHLRLNGTNVYAYSGTASLQALGDVVLEAAMTDKVHAATSTGWKRSWWGKKTTWTTYHDRAWRNANPVNVSARDINIKAGNNVATYASKLNATNNLRIEAGDQALYYAVKNETDHSDTTYTKKSWIGIRYDKSTEHNTSRISTPVVSMLYASNGNLTSYSGGDQLFQGTDARYTTRDIQAGVGEKARADARIILEGVKSSVFEQRTKESDYVVWQRKIDQGSYKETLTLPSFSGPDTTPFKAPGGISVQIPEGSEIKTQIQTLSQQPGMAYLNDLAQRNDVNWQPVKLAHEQWNYKQEGLTPAGAALLGAAVAWATGGMGANLVGGTVTNAAGVTTTTLGGHMANAAFMSLSSQAAITLVNNKGNIGKTLEALAKSDIVKATIAAALTAGVLEKLNATQTLQDLSQKTGFSEKLTYNLINAGGRALTNTAINGGDLQEALKQALVGGLVDTAHGQVASKIGLANLDYVSHKLAHALAGCVAGAAAGGACKDGAIGGAVGEIVGEMFKGQVPHWNASDAEWVAFDEKVKAYGKFVSGAVAAYAGGNAQTAITTAEIAIDNNTRINMRAQAAQNNMTPQQYFMWVRAQSLQQAITLNGGSVPPNMTVPGARVNYTQSDIARLEGQLRSLSPNHQLIYSAPTATLSPLPYSYVNMQTAVNMTNVPGAIGSNAFSFPSGGNAYFRELLRTQPQMFSQTNRDLILREGVNPRVDSQWVQYNPTHASFLRETLIHHHLFQGSSAVAIPTSVHRNYYSILHPYR